MAYFSRYNKIIVRLWPCLSAYESISLGAPKEENIFLVDSDYPDRSLIPNSCCISNCNNC